ncbi:uncharacterized protein CPUR_05404 [Claviceps purpurea 20.1]|uniref:Uncharacterized protein n=1 Tax=Claviceps purpurea (strain 20.1) TaxID=1111077 RepID=M1W262_CLAP2|nr:hypothetical protein E4U28_007200 [Claviceps purpurea]KAG6284134.1 hypothetical protein E4U46_007466 [Claviceps purpurea]CCE31551.1 uncharacterized protein CPUR_05404 [Claviceps purpurea 20.1]
MIDDASKIINDHSVEGQQGYVFLGHDDARTIATFTVATYIVDTLSDKEYGYDIKLQLCRISTQETWTRTVLFFIANAKVVTFAEYHGVARLLDLAIQKLHNALCRFIIPTLECKIGRHSGLGALLLRTIGFREAEEGGGIVLAVCDAFLAPHCISTFANYNAQSFASHA